MTEPEHRHRTEQHFQVEVLVTGCSGTGIRLCLEDAGGTDTHHILRLGTLRILEQTD